MTRLRGLRRYRAAFLALVALVGLAGAQRVAIDPRSGRVLVLRSHAADYMAFVYALFDDWSSR